MATKNLFGLFKDKKILVVDDFSQMRESIRHMLGTFGANQVDIAADGEKAVALARGKRYDIILCDYYLGPGKDGQQVLEELKHNGYFHPASIFMMFTAENNMQMVMGAIEYRPDDYLSKPFTKDMLRKRIERLLRKKDHFQEIDKHTRAGDLESAFIACDQALSNPENKRYTGELLHIKSDLCIDQKKYDHAIAIFEKVLSIKKGVQPVDIAFKNVNTY